ncbi:MAG TPA: penicillin-binding protein 2 [Coxiellaceae bacterium]|nr:MAG: penicillin-binding protein 2 [Gammaproteobacteria bacterium RIFCSPHIGHO2_12_FULL_36_30]HLB56813.1 penicillin-binding protein 2 [Coxiellaceae bacterium]
MNTPNPESKRFHKRSVTCASIILFLFFILFIRLCYLQLFEHSFYATLSKRNVISIIPVRPDRGIIYDRNGVVLAKNIPVYSLMIIPGRVKNMKHTINALKKVISLTPQEIQNFYHIVKQYYPYQAVPLKEQLTEAQVDSFYVNQYQFPGVTVQTNMIRTYPLGNATSDVVGYVGRITANELTEVNPANYTASDEIGKAGVESEDEILLHGVMGSEEAEIDATGKVVRILKKTPPIAGDNIYLTIDSKLQVYANKLLGKNTGAIVAIQPATGQVLAMVTKPNYNPNEFVNGLSQAQYDAIINAPDHPMFNRATRAQYAPGSAIKPFIAFGGLNDGIIDTQDYIYDPGWFRLPGTKHIFHNWKKFGWVNVTKAITVSCDTFFYQLAAVMGIDRVDQTLTQFGFGNLTGINLPMEKPGVVPSPAWKMKALGQPWYEGDTVETGIGQGYILVTPIQLATAVSTMAERGLRFQPTVLLKLQQPNGSITTMQPIIESPIVAKDPKAWQTVINAMQDVITNPQGTAYPSFQNITYTAAGKTGTAQVAADNSQGNVAQIGVRFQNNHFFIVFAPVNNPQIAIAVAVEHIAGMTQRGVLIARKLLDFYMREQSANASKNINTAPQVALPTPQAPAKNTENTAGKVKKQNLPAPAGPSLLPNETMKSIENKKPVPTNNSNTNANTIPPTTQNNNPAQQTTSKSVIHSAYLDQLQQEMETKVKAQMEMQADMQNSNQ